MNTEKNIWQDHQAHYSETLTYLFCLISCWLIIPIFYAIWTYYKAKSSIYTLTEQRLIIQYGVFDIITSETELYRIKDYQLQQPFFLRIFGLSTIVLASADKINPNIILYGIKDGLTTINAIRNQVEIVRDRHNIRALDIVT